MVTLEENSGPSLFTYQNVTKLSEKRERNRFWKRTVTKKFSECKNNM